MIRKKFKGDGRKLADLLYGPHEPQQELPLENPDPEQEEDDKLEK